MSIESFDPNAAHRSRGETGIDIKHDPKQSALETIYDFLGLTTDVILNGPVQNLPRLNELAHFGQEKSRDLQPNQRLARSMIGLEQAVSAIRQAEPPIERGEEIRSVWSNLDGETGELTTMKFYCGKTGSDFGTFLNCHYNYDVEEHPRNGSRMHVTLPSDHYLYETLRWGDPHEPVFYASEPDTYSPEWSAAGEEWLENGGRAVRRFDSMRAWEVGKTDVLGGNPPNDVFQRDMVTYTPLYNRQSALGVEKYVEITQKLLKMFVQSVHERDS